MRVPGVDLFLLEAACHEIHRYTPEMLLFCAGYVLNQSHAVGGEEQRQHSRRRYSRRLQVLSERSPREVVGVAQAQ